MNKLRVEVVGLRDAGIEIEVDETENTFEGNAWLKANALRKLWPGNILADDSGLCIEALGGAPGVMSARYAGEPTSHEKNVSRVLQEMQFKTNRKAYFVTVLVGFYRGKPFEVKGFVHGNITNAPMGWGGFGYDPIFIPQSASRTFAEMTNEEKNLLSHRAEALKKWSLQIKK